MSKAEVKPYRWVRDDDEQLRYVLRDNPDYINLHDADGGPYRITGYKIALDILDITEYDTECLSLDFNVLSTALKSTHLLRQVLNTHFDGIFVILWALVESEGGEDWVEIEVDEIHERPKNRHEI